jgi:L-fuculose-phosphate aldolase
MEPEQLVYMDLASAGYYGDFLPSSEWRMHLDIYRARPAAQAILHAHPTYSTALAVQRREIPAFHYMVGAAGGKKIPCAGYATFGTQELSDEILDALGDTYSACLMANHGMVRPATSDPPPRLFLLAFF